MSGHSKWAKIKRQKGITDQKRGAIFTKISRNITMAAKEGGPDPDSNFSLRLLIDKAKQVNMPLENIDRAIKKASGSDGKNTISKMSYEAVAHNGIVMVIDCQTDNTNRTVSEVKSTLEKNGAKMASIGSISWQFNELGFIEVKPAKLKKGEKYGEGDKYESVDFEETEMDLMEVEGINDISEGESQDEEGNSFRVLDIYTDKTAFSKVVKEIEAKKLQILNYEIIKKAKDIVDVPEDYQEKIDKLIDTLEEMDDVDFVWLNI
jgi:YebC/PmpR family DNA-binding regulatory protein